MFVTNFINCINEVLWYLVMADAKLKLIRQL